MFNKRNEIRKRIRKIWEVKNEIKEEKWKWKMKIKRMKCENWKMKNEKWKMK